MSNSKHLSYGPFRLNEAQGEPLLISQVYSFSVEIGFLFR
jgi:hypothetical protein